MASSTRIFGKCCRALMAAAKTTSAATATGTVTKARGRPNGILKPQPVSPALANFLGTNEASRTDAVKKVWEYIKTHNLQLEVWQKMEQSMSLETDCKSVRGKAVDKIWSSKNPANKREIHCDNKLKTIFDGKDKVGFLEIARLLTQHFQKTA